MSDPTGWYADEPAKPEIAAMIRALNRDVDLMKREVERFQNLSGYGVLVSALNNLDDKVSQLATRNYVRL